MGRKRYKPQEIVAKLRRACGDRHRLEATELAAASTGAFPFLRPTLAMVAPDRGRVATITLWKN